ncbi:MAG: hypothetical protein DRG58_03585 [Deltaproteobacteria bacterium]|nr:MAG: hypothetical protein DRG58_03585 [Deltaproteobacteria bacterium]
MSWFRFLVLSALVVVLGGCATATPTPVAAPVERALYYYVGAKELDLRQDPNPQSDVTATVTLNERVEKTDQSSEGWFKVVTADGRSGWASEKYFKLDEVTDFYVNRWGRRLRTTPNVKAQAVTKLRLNDQVKLLDPHPQQGWVRVQVQRDQSQGWLELRDLSLDRVVVRRTIRRAAPAGSTKGEAETEAASKALEEEAPAEPSTFAPAPAQAAPPSTGPKATPTGRKVRPEMFEPF